MSDSAFIRTERYRDRPIAFLGMHEHQGWRLKRYAITFGPESLEGAIYDEGQRLADQRLPLPAVTRHRPGVGFVICHQGRGWHYLVVNWWDNENEYFNRVYVRRREGGAWREASAGESACVWDLQVIWHERQAYVRHVLGAERGADLDGYLHDVLPTAGG